jgi:hypothetical protein
MCSLALSAQEVTVTKPTAVVAPGRVLESGISTEVKAQLQKFDLARESYLRRQKELADQVKASSVSDRKQLRAQMEELRKQWIDASFQLRKEAQARIPDLRSLSRFEALGAAKALTDDAKRDKRLK